MLAEFKYGLEPKETFAKYFGDQAKPRRYTLLTIRIRSSLTVILGSTTISRKMSSRSFTGIICCKDNGSGQRAWLDPTMCKSREGMIPEN